MNDISPIRSQHLSVSRVSASQSASLDATTASSTNTRPTDSVELSDTAHLMAQLKAMPDVREDLVANVKAAIADGSYLSDSKIEGAIDGLLEDLG